MLLLLLGLSALGCNVFDGVGPSATSVDGLLTDAQVALTNGNPERAVDLLETAYRKDSTNVEVRVDLANALYAANDVDLFVVRSALERLNGREAEAVDEESKPSTCTDGARPTRSPDRFLAVSFVGADGVQALAAHRQQIRRVARLVIDGVLDRRPEAFAAASVETRSRGYLLAALTRLSARLLAVREALRATEGTLYLDQGSDASRALVACASTADRRVRVEQSLCRHAAGVGRATSWLEVRNDLLSSAGTSLLLDLLGNHREALRARRSCSASSPTVIDDAGLQRPPGQSYLEAPIGGG